MSTDRVENVAKKERISKEAEVTIGKFLGDSGFDVTHQPYVRVSDFLPKAEMAPDLRVNDVLVEVWRPEGVNQKTLRDKVIAKALKYKTGIAAIDVSALSIADEESLISGLTQNARPNVREIWFARNGTMQRVYPIRSNFY